MKKAFVAAAVALVASTGAFAGEQTLTVNFGELNLMNDSYNATSSQTDTFALPAGVVIDSADFSGTFGKTSVFDGSSAYATLWLNGIQFLDARSLTPDVDYNDASFDSTLSPAIVASLYGGSADFFTQQTSYYEVRLSETTLTIDYHTAAAVPEASNTALLLAGLGLVGFIARRKKHA